MYWWARWAPSWSLSAWGAVQEHFQMLCAKLLALPMLGLWRKYVPPEQNICSIGHLSQIWRGGAGGEALWLFLIVLGPLRTTENDPQVANCSICKLHQIQLILYWEGLIWWILPLFPLWPGRSSWFRLDTGLLVLFNTYHINWYLCDTVRHIAASYFPSPIMHMAWIVEKS